MKISSIEIKNFKAIASACLKLSDFNVIVGANGSGKSSVLQAMHWMFQSGRHPIVYGRSNPADGVTLSEKNATYMPSPDYRNAGNSAEYGNKTGSPQFDMAVSATMDDGTQVTADLWIKSARNEGLLVHVPSSNSFITHLRDQSREFSAYIPGLAGIPLSEEKRSQAIVHRLAAAGDANTVLRNVLLLLRGREINGKNGLSLLEDYVAQAIGRISLDVSFSDERDSTITARFQTAEMMAGEKRWKALELAGVGYLQIIQMFAYLIYFQPALLLVDEPDAHLHPTTQERLVPVLVAASKDMGTQVILTTHSPSVVRALPGEANVIWMKDGKVQANGNTEGRQMMGWGLLDRKILMLTEDKDSGMIRSLLAQWPHLDRAVAVWPLRGSGKLPDPEVIRDFVDLTAGSMKVIIHRDRDFLMPQEISVLSEPYERHGHSFWVTKHSDMEAYWTNPRAIAGHFGILEEEANEVLMEALAHASEDNAALETRRRKRNDAANKFNKKGNLPQFGDNDVEAQATIHGAQYAVLGKDLRGAIRAAAQKKKLSGSGSFSLVVPPQLAGQMADELRDKLDDLLNS
ncbi:ATP-dependent nuclease [Agrobacterium cavarae]|uniref:ATP-dependent nuclease n=1 Tax=Agrobacterium cavarae TaxID=2528239 RepID=UPI0028B11B89|nr:AAA family ATPase [Agrobacterium cavarae]